ncbi:MAG: hypothetical protein AB1420_11430 [Bacillota bacterium]
MDLINWDMEANGNIKLDGNWEFYWDQLIKPGDFELPEVQLTGYYPAPLYWTRYDELNLPSKGCATYRLVVYTPKIYKNLSIKTSEIYTEYSLYINGEKIYSHGSFEEQGI